MKRVRDEIVPRVRLGQQRDEPDDGSLIGEAVEGEGGHTSASLSPQPVRCTTFASTLTISPTRSSPSQRTHPAVKPIAHRSIDCDGSESGGPMRPCIPRPSTGGVGCRTIRAP